MHIVPTSPAEAALAKLQEGLDDLAENIEDYPDCEAIVAHIESIRADADYARIVAERESLDEPNYG